MRNNPAFINVLNYITDNNITKEQILGYSDTQIENIMFPNGRENDDYTRISSVINSLKLIYQKRKRAATVQDIIDRLETTYPSITIDTIDNSNYLLKTGDND